MKPSPLLLNGNNSDVTTSDNNRAKPETRMRQTTDTIFLNGDGQKYDGMVAKDARG